MSSINTNGINVSYPIPGQNNSTQGFRDNFTAIKTNLNTAGDEISDLQNKVVLKSALANSVLNNNMENTIISNCQTLNFRASTYNLGNALSGTVLINLDLGDVQYGTIAGNTTFNFGSWAPTQTLSQVELQLNISNTDAVISFSGNVSASLNNGTLLFENYTSANGFVSFTAPYDVTQINLRAYSIDCGSSVSLEPINRPYKSTQIQLRTPSPVGFQGDVAGTVAVDANYLYVCTDTFDSTLINATANSTTGTSFVLSGVSISGTAGQFTCSAATSPLVVGQTVTISGTPGGTGSISGYNNPTTYSITATNGSTTFTLAADSNGSAITTTVGTPTGLSYSVKNNYITFDAVLPGTVVANMPVIFDTMEIDGDSVTTFGGISASEIYYVKSISSNNITLSASRTGGIADGTLPLTTVSANVGNTTMDAKFYDGTDIWKRVALTTW